MGRRCFLDCVSAVDEGNLSRRAWTSEEKEAFGKTVIDQISNYSPNFKDLILHAEIRMRRCAVL